MSRYSKNKMSNWVAGIAVHRSARAIFITLLVALFMVMTSALPALASDGKIYPGSMGVRSSGTSTPIILWSAIGNPSSGSWLYLDLPVIKNTKAGNINKSWVRVIDQHYKENVSCKLCSVYRSGCIYTGSFSPTKESSGSGSNEQVLLPGGVTANSQSYHYFSCKIPPKYSNNTSYIISYFVEED